MSFGCLDGREDDDDGDGDGDSLGECRDVGVGDFGGGAGGEGLGEGGRVEDFGFCFWLLQSPRRAT